MEKAHVLVFFCKTIWKNLSSSLWKRKDKEESKGHVLQQIKGQNCLKDEPRPPREVQLIVNWGQK